MLWFERDPERLHVESHLMRARTRARLVRTGNLLTWLEDLTSREGTRFRLAIEYPEAFPYVAPRAFIVRPTILTAPHRLTDGALCLFPNPTLADAPKTSAYVVRNRAVIWFLGYEDWKRTGTWRASEH
jgi:hypothetical protein